ncbi:MAG: hypothetical protein AAGG02_03285 [Cyanobacteria bacterium P01_H01_bin.15]
MSFFARTIAIAQILWLTTPFVSSAQPFAGSRTQSVQATGQFAIAAGSQLPTQSDQTKILLTSTESMPLNLRITANIRDRRGQLLIPAGSEIEGQLEPGTFGTRFVGETLIIGNQRYSIQASSASITRTETVTRRAKAGDIAKGAAVGAAAASAVAAITGDVDAPEVLGGAGLGALGGLLLGRRQVELVAIEPAQDLRTITLERSFTLR